ncbi:hypothetical protein D3C86_1829800 [compost metagenome]
MGDLGQGFIAQLTHRGLVVGQGIVEGQLVIVQAQCIPALAGGGELLGHFDQFFDHLGGFDGAVLVALDHAIEQLGELLLLGQVAGELALDLPLQQALQ